MDSVKASNVKVSGDLAKNKLARKLNNKPDSVLSLNVFDHKKITDEIGTEGKISLRVGKNWQFHLGDMIEISCTNFYCDSLKMKEIDGKNLICGIHNIAWEDQLKQLKLHTFWEKYFAKGSSIFCFSNDGCEYFFFNFKDIINYIIENTNWRLLATGRIKGTANYREAFYTGTRPASATYLAAATASLTNVSANSSVLLMVTGSFNPSTSNTYVNVYVTRGASRVTPLVTTQASAAGNNQSIALAFIDPSPATGSQNYTVYMRAVNGTADWGADTGNLRLTALELF